jgi:effector-binding domain-containing protein
MAYTVTISRVAPQWILAARAVAKQSDVSKTMLGLLGPGWDFVKRNGIKTDGQNVAVYRGAPDGVAIEAGPRLLEKIESSVATPSGLAASVIHMGPYEQLGQAHKAIVDWCEANGHVLEGTNWEVYGHHEDDPAKRRTDVFYLLRS